MTYISISNVLVPTCWSNATTAKIWYLRIVANFFPRQKLEIFEFALVRPGPMVKIHKDSMFKSWAIIKIRCTAQCGKLKVTRQSGRLKAKGKSLEK